MDRNSCGIPALTAERRYGSIDRLDEDALPVKLRRVSRELHSQVKRRKRSSKYLFTTLCIEQDPAKLDYFSGILGYIYTMFITGCCHMNDHITVQIGFLPLIVCHSSMAVSGRPRQCQAVKQMGAAAGTGKIENLSSKQMSVERAVDGVRLFTV